MHQSVTDLINKKIIESAHDVSEGGVFVTLAESSFPKKLGFKIIPNNKEIRKDAFLFGEAQGRVIVSVSKENIDDFESLLNIPFQKLGIITPGEINVDNEDWGNIKEWNEKYDSAIGNHFKHYIPE